MQPDTSQKWSQAKFVERVEMATMQYVMLAKAAQQNEVTRDNLQQTFRGGIQMSGDHFEHCLQQLVKENHLKEAGNKYTITDDGREDVQKLAPIFRELPNLGASGASQDRQPQPAAAGGRGTTGNVGQQNPGQPKGGPGGSSR